MKNFGLDEIQANAILEMRLKTLSGLQREKIEDEYDLESDKKAIKEYKNNPKTYTLDEVKIKEYYDVE